MMGINKILWLEDQHEDFGSYLSALYRAGYIVDTVQSVSDAVMKMRDKVFMAYVLDIKVLPGDDEEWITLDRQKREENPNFDSYLGLELMRSLFNPEQARVKINPPIILDRQRVFVLSVVVDRPEEVSSLGIPADHIIYKSVCDLDTLPRLLERIEKNE
jgi:hypothetical protein